MEITDFIVSEKKILSQLQSPYIVRMFYELDVYANMLATELEPCSLQQFVEEGYI